LANPQLLDNLQQVIAGHTAGSPVEPDQLWTNRSPQEIATELCERGSPVCANTVARLLREELGLSHRQLAKTLPTGASQDREAQFERMLELRAEFLRKGWPVLSIDTKKKELLGLYHRPGRAFSEEPGRAWDHDFTSLATGKVIPYGVYDLARQEALVMLAQGADTGELAVTAIRRWWHRLGKHRYRGRDPILLIADCGGSNGYRVPLFRERLSRLANQLQLTFRVSHVPPYCSKYNPIDHRLFCHLTRSLSGLLLKSVDVIRDAFARTTTSTGLRVVVETARKIFQPKIKPLPEFTEHEPTQRDEHLPNYNYVIAPG
jgi:Rhodopirellula transposase DDE domain